MKFLVTFALALGAASAYETVVPLKDLVIDNRTESRIANGRPAANGQFPYQVSLVLNPGPYACGGSIISSQYVLTAAHCTNGFSSGIVYYGSTLRTGGRSAYFDKSAITQHPGFNPDNLNNDISLIRVPLILGGVVRAIGLPPRAYSYSTYAGNYALISGYGRTINNGQSSNTLNWARAQIITNSVCQKEHGQSFVNDGTICIAVLNRVSTCEGDSGGPLALEGVNQLVGVFSFLSAYGCSAGHSSGFARVTYFRDWIYYNSGI